MNTIKLNVIGELTSSGEDVAIDLGAIGYTEDTVVTLGNIETLESDLKYSKQKYDEWNSNNTSTNRTYYKDEEIVYAPNIDTSKSTNAYQMFAGCTNLKTVPNLNMSNVTNMGYMFWSCGELVVAPIFDTSKVTDMNNMFCHCNKLEYILKFNTSKVSNMSYMFDGCEKLTSIPPFNTASNTNTAYMFRDCKLITEIPSIDTSKVTNMHAMFYDCKSLKTIPMLDCSGSPYIGSMFLGCSALENFGGLKNVNQDFSLGSCHKLTHDSLMNVINNLYDFTVNGLSGKTLTLGSTNLAKLTADEIAIGTNKGWTIN